MRRQRYIKPAGYERAVAAEVISWTIWPPGPPIAVIMTTMWLQPYYGNVAASIADGMARGFRVKPRDTEQGT
jgi:hypothetical protein